MPRALGWRPDSGNHDANLRSEYGVGRERLSDTVSAAHVGPHETPGPLTFGPNSTRDGDHPDLSLRPVTGAASTGICFIAAVEAVGF
jgi:hypothetical protein